MNMRHITVSVNNPNFKFKIDNWLKLINDDKYKKFALTPRDNFYFYLNYFKKILDEKTILTEEIRKIFTCWYLECCQRNYRKNFSEMSLENKDIRKDYREFRSRYNL